MTDGELDINIKALHDKVVIKKAEVFHERILDGGIVVPIKSEINHRLTKGTIVSIGEKAMKDLEGLEVGDTVLYDHLSAFHDTHPIVVVNSENIICAVED